MKYGGQTRVELIRCNLALKVSWTSCTELEWSSGTEATINCGIPCCCCSFFYLFQINFVNVAPISSFYLFLLNDSFQISLI